MNSARNPFGPDAPFAVPPPGGPNRGAHAGKWPWPTRPRLHGEEPFSLSPQRGEGRGEGCENLTPSTRRASSLEKRTSAPLATGSEAGCIPTTRREFLKGVTAALSSAVMAGDAPVLSAAPKEVGGLVDVNVNLGRWPLRRVPGDEPEALVARLRSRGVTQAWAGSLDGLLHKDLGAVNARLAEECRRHGRGWLVPFGSINPTSPGWEQDFQRAVEVHRFPGVRLHPNYHGYRLEDPAFERLLRQAADHRVIVQLALVMEDERMMHPRLRVEPVDPAPLAEVVRRTPGLRLVLLNALRTLRGESLRKLLGAGDVSVEISMLEGVGGIASLLDQVPAERVLFGSHAPLFYFEAAELKLKESPLTPKQRGAIGQGNARRLLA